MEELDDVEIGEIGKRSSRGPSQRLLRASLLFGAVLVVAATAALALGENSRAWGYVGAFAVTAAIGAAVIVRADRHARGSLGIVEGK